MAIDEEIGDLLRARGLTLTTAESCTGGLLGHLITSVPGSSDYYLGGLIAYSYEAKEALLGVRHETLVAHGAVSEETAREMARGARRRLGADVALSITGIAGPTGATPDKPVGLVYMALSAADAERCARHVWQGDRLENNRRSADAALELLWGYLQERAGSSYGQGVGIATETSRPCARSSPYPPAEEEKMLEFIDEPVGVEAQARAGGPPRPMAFHWRARRHPIESWGRESSTTREGHAVRCYLVQTAGPETWELCLEMETAQWTLKRHWAARPPIA